jgi:hypothetical protein
MNTKERNFSFFEKQKQTIHINELESKRKIYMGEIHYLPSVLADKKGLVNEISRSSLFTTRSFKKKRYAEEGKILYCVGKERVEYWGIELRAADDEIVWAVMLSYASEEKLGDWIEFTARQACLELNWPTNGNYYKRLRSSLNRLRSGVFAISSPRFGEWSGKTINMIMDFEWKDEITDKPLSKYRIKIHPAFELLFGRNYTKLEWETYLKLTPIERRIYDYSCCHKEPNPLKLETLKTMCDSDSTDDNFSKMVKKSLKKLKSVDLVDTKIIKNTVYFFEKKYEKKCSQTSTS